VGGGDEDDPEPSAAAPPPPAPADGFLDFPKGKRTGCCVHNFFEKADFRTLADPGAAENAYGPVIDQLIRSYGLAGREDTDDFKTILARRRRQMLSMAAQTVSAELRLDGAGIRLAELDMRRTLRELRFYFPAPNPVAAEDIHRLIADYAPDGIAAALRAGKSTHGEGNCHGLMEGAVDLIFEHGGRHYLADWKTNWLGDGPQDYAQPRLLARMVSENYLLQYHIYAVAMHRHLAVTLPGYDYDRDFGGVFYLFVRGMGGDDGGGVFAARPDRTLIVALDRLFQPNHPPPETETRR
jgi:exodeoxyribonuclease V beta subunit